MLGANGELPRLAGNPFHDRLNLVLDEPGFDPFAEEQCAKFWADGRPPAELGAGPVPPDAAPGLPQGVRCRAGWLPGAPPSRLAFGEFLDIGLHETRSVDLVAETFADSCLTLQHLASVTRRARMRIVRNLCRYADAVSPAGFRRAVVSAGPPSHPAAHLHRQPDGPDAGTLARTPNSPLRPQNMRLAVVVLATTGLRRGELTRLTVGDYDPPQRTLAIRESKFHKSRLVPVSADAAHEVER